MFYKIKIALEKELKHFLNRLDERYAFKRQSPLLYTAIRNFTLLDGKRIRPTLFLISYLGLREKTERLAYSVAAALEFLHDFVLIHDDIIDKATIRRGAPSLHAFYDRLLKRYPHIKFSGKDLAMVTGDIMFALSLDSLLKIDIGAVRKEKVLKLLMEAAIRTAQGEFLELFLQTKAMGSIKEADIFNIYELKTAHYTFACPLGLGALFAGAAETEIKKLFRYGMCIGKAFQIKDDITGMCSNDEKSGKSSLIDLQEARDTILVWYAYNHLDKTGKNKLRSLLTKKDIRRRDLKKMRALIFASGALTYAEEKIRQFQEEALRIARSFALRPSFHTRLNAYVSGLLTR